MTQSDVQVNLGLNVEGAKAQARAFFDGIKNQKITGDPLKGLSESLRRARKANEEFSSKLTETSQKLKNLGGGQAAQQVVKLGQSAKTAAGGFLQMQRSAEGIKTPLQAISSSAQGINKIGQASTTAGNALQKLGGSATTTKVSLTSLGGSSAQGILKISTASSKASQSLAGLVQKTTPLKSALNGVGASASSLRQISTSTKALSQSMGNAVISTGSLARALSQTRPAASTLGSLGHAVQSVAGGARTAGTAFGSMAQALNRAGQSSTKITGLPTSMRRLSTSTVPVVNSVRKVGTELSRASKVGTAFANQLKGAFQNVLAGIPQGIGMALGNGLLAPLKLLTAAVPAAVNEFRQLDEVMRLTLAISGAGQEQFGRLTTALLEVSSASAATAQEVGQVQQSLARAGFSLEQIEAATAGVVNGAEATGTAYQAMADITVSALGAFGMAATQASEVTDSLTVAANNSNQTVTDLGDALKYVAPVAASTGQSLDDVNLSLGLLANSGIKASTAGTSLRTLLTNLTIASSGAGEEFTKLSRGSARLQSALRLIGAEVTNANGELKPMRELLGSLQEGFNKLDTGERALISKVLAGNEGLPTLNTLMGASEAQIGKIADALENKTGAAAKQAKEALAGLSGSFKLLQSNISAALVQIGQVIAVVLKPLVDGITTVLSVLNKLPGPIKNLLVSLALLGTAVGATVATFRLLKLVMGETFAAGLINNVLKFVSAFKGANLATTVTGWTNALKLFGAEMKAKFITGLTKATAALKSFSAQKAITKVMSGLRGSVSKLGATFGRMPKKVNDFGSSVLALKAVNAQAAKGVTTHASSLLALKQASAAGAAGTAGLGKALLGFGAAAAKIALPVGVVVAAVAGMVAAWKQWQDATKHAKKSQEELDQSLKKVGKGAETATGGLTGWGKAIGDLFGPLDGLLNKISPVYKMMKQLAEWAGNVVGWVGQRIAISAVNDAHKDFQKSLQKSNQKIAENRARMAQLNPTSEEYGRLAKENTALIDAQQSSVKARITSIDEEIKKLSENKQANQGQIEALKRSKAELERQLPTINANVEALARDAEAHRKAGGEVDNYTVKLKRLAEERGKAHKQIDLSVYQTELKALQDVRDGLILEAEQRMVNAKAALQATNEKIDIAEKEIAEYRRLYGEGKITEDQYVKAKADATKSIEKELKDRVQQEIAVQKATSAAVNARLDEYTREVNAIASNVRMVNSMLSELGQVQLSGIGALKSLADSITAFQIQGIEKVKSKRTEAIDKAKERELKMIDSAKGARLAMLEASGLKDEALSRARTNLEKKFDNQRTAAEQKFQQQREEAEKRYEEEKKRIMQRQIQFEEKALEAKTKAKEAQLELWRAEQTISNAVAVNEAKAAYFKAKASGASKEQLTALSNQIGLLEAQGGFIEDAYNLKKDILGFEKKAAENAIANKAAQNDVNSAYKSQVGNIGQVEQALGRFETTAGAIRDKLSGMGSGLQAIPDEAEQVFNDVIKQGNRVAQEVTFESLNEQFRRSLPPELAAAKAQEMIQQLGEGGRIAGDLAATNIADRFGDAIPKELLKDQLIQAMAEGGNLSVEKAREAFGRLPKALPQEQVAMILGNAMEGGYAEGLATIKQMPVPEGTFSPLGEGLTKELSSTTPEVGDVMEKVGKVAVDSFRSPLGPGLAIAQGVFENWGEITGAISGEKLSEGIKSSLGDAVEILDPFASRVTERFGTMIPKETIKQDLLLAFSDGSLAGDKVARERFAELPDAMPKTEIAKALAEGYGIGIKEGEALLSSIEVPPTMRESVGQGVSEGMKDGATDGVKSVEAKVKANENKIGDALGEAFKLGADKGNEHIEAWAESSSETISGAFTKGGENAAKQVVQSFKDSISEVKRLFGQIGSDFKLVGIGAKLEQGLKRPIAEASNQLTTLRLPPSLAADMSTVAKSASEVKSSGIGGELIRASEGAKGAKSASNGIKSAMRAAATSASRYATQMERAARAAQAAARARWSGGPVAGGQQYTVNEIGKEMFMSSSGRISEINAPQNGQWVAPSSGTVIPAHIASQIRQSREAKAATSASSISQGSASQVTVQVNEQGGNGQGALLRELRRLNTTSQAGPVTNNVSITSQAPVNDASKLMADMARLRAARRR